MVSFGLNQIVAPGANEEAFLKMASDLGCVGVELRQDAMSISLTEHRAQFFAETAKSNNLEILSLSEISAFDRLTTNTVANVEKLAKMASIMGAKAINLIPCNNPGDNNLDVTKAERLKNLKKAMSEIAPILSDCGIRGLIEPLGFETASIRYKSDVAEAIYELGLESHFGLVHDTFHHALAGEKSYYPELTGLVHVSSVLDSDMELGQLRDDHRVLVSPDDRLKSIQQIQELQTAGYNGPVSFEPFSETVQNAKDLSVQLSRSINFIEDHVEKCVA